MEKHSKIKKHIEEAKRVLDLFCKWYENDLNDEVYENIITAIDEIIDELYGAQLKAIELDETMEQEMNNKITKEQKIKFIIDLLERSDEEYIDDVFQVLLKEDITYLPSLLGDDDWEALKSLILNGDIE